MEMGEGKEWAWSLCSLAVVSKKSRHTLGRTLDSIAWELFCDPRCPELYQLTGQKTLT